MYGVEASGDAESIRIRESTVIFVDPGVLSLGSCWGGDILLISIGLLIRTSPTPPACRGRAHDIVPALTKERAQSVLHEAQNKSARVAH
jgi:hypothetical protein